MAHFAQVDNENNVQQVIVVANSDCGGGNFPESEPIGQAFILSLGITGQWLQTSYHASFRGEYAGTNSVFLSDVGEYGTFTVLENE